MRSLPRVLFLVLVASASVLLFITSGSTSNSPLIISEFRFRGPNGANDEFVEIYNNTDMDHTVAASDGSSGYALVASDGHARFVIPNGTVIPARGHYLGVNTIAYSLASYATGDATFTTDIPDNAGVALFNTSNPANFTLGNRFDAVGSTGASALYREGAGFAPLTPFSVDYSFVRNISPFIGEPDDSNDNATDFLFVDTNGTSAGAGQRLGAPGPENLSAQTSVGTAIGNSPLDPTQADFDSPNVARDFTSDLPNNSTFGTISIRRTFTNNTGGNITRLRFRIIYLTTFPAPSGVSDLRPRTSGNIVVTTSGGNTNVAGTGLEQPPSQPNGGGFNSSMSVTSISDAAPLANGDSVNVQFLMGIEQTGCYALDMIAESTPAAGGNVFRILGNTESSGIGACGAPTPTPMPTPIPSPTVSPTPVPTPSPTPMPIITSSVALTSLSPSNNDLVNVGLAATANEPATFNVQVFGDENDETPTSTTPFTLHSPDAKDIAIGTLRLRAERVNSGDGRVYLVVVTATNSNGNANRACHTVVVEKNKKGDVDAQAAAARAFCEANNGAAPPGYFVIGDGPIIGPKQ